MDLLAYAKTIAERVEAEASGAKVPVAVCVIDVHGNVVLHHRMPSPVRLTTRPWRVAIVGSMRSLRSALSRARVPSSSAPASRL